PTPDDKKWNWIATGGEAACWRLLNVTTDGPVRYVYSVVAGAPGQAPPGTIPSQTAAAPTWPNPTREPWYVGHAIGDLNYDSVVSSFLASSFSGEIYVENEAQ